MLKKLFILFLAFFVGLQPVLASDLSGAFSNLMGNGAAASVSSPGRYTAGARNIFVGGGAEVRFPRSNVTLFSVAPPSFAAGCQGISAHFGGFSFISGKEIETLVRNIAQGAPGLVINLVIKSLCPMCEAVLQNMQHLASFAAKTNMDSCHVASNLVNMLGKELTPTSPEGSSKIASACGVKSSAINDSSDYGAASISVCNSLKASVSKLEGMWADIEKGMYSTDGKAKDGVKQDTSSERCMLGAGNCTWIILNQMFAALDEGSLNDETVKQKLLLMNMMGTTVSGPNASCGDAAVSTDVANAPITSKQCLPKLEVRDVVALFMCGKPGSIDPKSTVWTEYCQHMFQKEGAAADVATSINALQLMDCANPDNSTESPYKMCKTLKMSTLGEMNLITGSGFLLETQRLLAEAVNRVRTNKPMGSDADGKRIIQLINIAPYPLYQAINAAAVYPEAGQSLVDSLSLLVADHLANAYFQRMLSGAANSNSAGLTVSPAMVERVAKAMNSLRMEADANQARLGKLMASQQQVMEEIRKVNQVIQQSVMSEQLLNAQKYANTINTKTAEPSTSGK